MGKERRERKRLQKTLTKNDGTGYPHTHYFVLWSATARPATETATTTFSRVSRFGWATRYLYVRFFVF